MRPFALLAAYLVPLAASAAPVVVLEGPVEVTADQTPDNAPTEGYLSLPLRAHNRASTPQILDLTFTSRPWATVTRSVPLSPGEERSATLIVPADARYGNLRAEVRSLGKRGSESFSFHQAGSPPVLIEGPPLTTNPSGAFYPRFVEAAELPDLLGAYVGYRAVWLTAPLEELAEPQRRALEAFAATGGLLCVTRLPRDPRPFLPLWNGTPRYGFGSVETCGGTDACLARLQEKEVVRLELPARANADPTPTDTLLAMAGAPAGAFLLIVLLFAVVLGPGSFFVRQRFGPQALLLFIPLTAFSTCAGIASYGALHEGFGVHASSRTMTLLDPVAHRAVSASVDGYYATLGPGAIRFAALEAVFTPSLRDLTVEEGEGLVYGGLVPARSYREYSTLSVATTRARLTLRREGGAVLVENALGARIETGLALSGGELCSFSGIADGGRAPASCQKATEARCSHVEDHVSPLGKLHDLLGTRFEANKLHAGALAPLGEHEFAVQLDRSVFAPTGGLTLKREKDVQIVRGTLSE